MKFTHLLALAATAGLMLTGCNNGGGSRESIRAVGSSTGQKEFVGDADSAFSASS